MKGSPEGAYHKKPFSSIALAGTESSYRTYSSPIISVTFAISLTLCTKYWSHPLSGASCISKLILKIILLKDVFPDDSINDIK